MNLEDVLVSAEEVQQFLVERKWLFCVIGAVALQRWGEPRFTQDVDLTLLTGFGKEEEFVDQLLSAFKPRRDNAREFSLVNRVLLVQSSRDVGIDIALGAFPFEENSIRRSSLWEFAPGRKLRTCSAEDLVIHKVFAGRNRDWGDVETILIRRLEQLDFKLIESELKPLLELKGEPDSLPKFNQLVQQVKRRI